MSVAYITHDICKLHRMANNHPECPERIDAVEAGLFRANLMECMRHVTAIRADRKELERVHSPEYIEWIESISPTGEVLKELDEDTEMNRYTLDAALYAAGAGIQAVDMIFSGAIDRAFCNVRPAGHHAGRNSAAGFCIFNTVAVAAAHAIHRHCLDRVAIVDIDVHHGNGTEDIFKNEPRVMLFSTFEHPLYPGSGADTISDNIINVPLPANTSSDDYRKAFSERILPKLESFRPQLVIFSAGFDAHRDDPMSSMALDTYDYYWVAHEVMKRTATSAKGRVISILEGGYNLRALSESAAAHVMALID